MYACSIQILLFISKPLPDDTDLWNLDISEIITRSKHWYFKIRKLYAAGGKGPLRVGGDT